MEIYPHARPPVTRRRQEAKYCLALGSFISIRSIRAYIYQDSKQLPLLTTSTLFSHSLHAVSGQRGPEKRLLKLFTPEDTIPLRGPVLLKKQGLIWLYWQEREVPLFFSPGLPLCRARPDPARRRSDPKSGYRHFFFGRCCANLPFLEAGRTLLKWLPL